MPIRMLLLQLLMTKETITFYQQLFENWIQQKQKDFRSITYLKYFQTKIQKQINLNFHVEITFDILGAQVIFQAISQPKLWHFSKNKQNHKRNSYGSIVEALFSAKFIDKRHRDRLIQQIESQQNWFHTKLKKFIHFIQVNGQRDVDKEWNVAMKISFYSFWQAIQKNQFYDSSLNQIFVILHRYLNREEITLAESCLQAREGLSKQEKYGQEETNNKMRVDKKNFGVSNIQFIQQKDHSKDEVSQIINLLRIREQ